MGRPLINLTGQRFGRLTVLMRNGTSSAGNSRWDCRCDCGGQTNVRATHLRSGNVQSCGCLAPELVKERLTTHGFSYEVEYDCWKNMLLRCRNPGHKAYKGYGGRGITVCERWDKFENFLADMGRRPSDKHSLDRENNDGNYEPGNCRWATKQQQANNRRRAKR